MPTLGCRLLGVACSANAAGAGARHLANTQRPGRRQAQHLPNALAFATGTSAQARTCRRCRPRAWRRCCASCSPSTPPPAFPRRTCLRPSPRPPSRPSRQSPRQSPRPRQTPQEQTTPGPVRAEVEPLLAGVAHRGDLRAPEAGELLLAHRARANPRGRLRDDPRRPWHRQKRGAAPAGRASGAHPRRPRGRHQPPAEQPGGPVPRARRHLRRAAAPAQPLRKASRACASARP